MVASERHAVHVARIAYANPTTPDNLRLMEPRLGEGARLILPGESLDVVYFACNSASVVIGDDAVEAAIRAAKPDAAVVTPPLAVRRALRALGAKRITLLTPYTVETTRPMIEYFESFGIAVASCTCFGLDDDRVMARITPASLLDAAREAIAGDAEALFISCTGLRAAAVAAEIEQAIGRPVVTSNQAGAWLTLRLCGDDTHYPQFGRLMMLGLQNPDRTGATAHRHALGA